MNKAKRSVTGSIRLIASLAPLMLWSQVSWAQALSLPVLPAGCSYSETSQQPLSGSVQIPAATPLYAAIGDAPTSLISLGVQCEGVLSSAVSFNLKESGALSWIGPGRDILATTVPGIGVRLFAEGQSDGGQCSINGWLGAGKGASCSLAAEGQAARAMSFNLKAQLVKIGHNTPIYTQQVMQLADGGSLLLTGQGTDTQVFDVLNSGMLTPTIITAASCTLITEQNHRVDFGEVHRPVAQKNEVTLGNAQATAIEVACSPLRDDGSNNYNVAITFNAGELHEGDPQTLASSIDDMAIRFSPKADGSEWHEFGKKYLLQHNLAAGADKSHFAQTWYWFLRYMPHSGHQKNGDFTAVATYTITIE